MLTTMRKIGNSRGVLIPAAFLASCQIEDQVEMQLQDRQIVIKPQWCELKHRTPPKRSCDAQFASGSGFFRAPEFDSWRI